VTISGSDEAHFSLLYDSSLSPSLFSVSKSIRTVLPFPIATSIAGGNRIGTYEPVAQRFPGLLKRRHSHSSRCAFGLWLLHGGNGMSTVKRKKRDDTVVLVKRRYWLIPTRGGRGLLESTDNTAACLCTPLSRLCAREATWVLLS